MKIASVIKNIELILQTPQGIELIRKFFINLAIKGKLDSKSSDDDAYPSNWLVVPANQVFKSRSGNSKLIKGKLFNEPGPNLFPGYSASGQDVWLSDWEHQGVAVILSAVGARCGKAFLATGKWSAIANTHIIWIDEELFLPDFAYLILNNEDFWIRSGSAQPFVKVKSTLEKLVGVPPLEEQKWIISKFKAFTKILADLQVAKQEQLILSKQARQSAVNSISTAQSPEELQIAWERIEGNWKVIAGDPESMESISLLIHDLATQGFLSRGENFEVVQLKDIAQVNYGYTESAQRAEVGPKFLRITDIQLGKVNWDAVPYCPISNADEERHLLRDGDLVFARTGATTGKSFLLNNPPRSVCASYLIRVRPDARKVLPEYLYLYFQSGQYWIDVKSGMSGTAQGGFNSSKLGALAIKIPDLATQAEIVKKTNELLQVCEDLGEFLSRQQLLAERFARSVVSISASVFA
jgi:restriction endonuclease S subunit